MIIDSLSVTNFRVFQGRHTFDLAPRIKWGSRKPVVLFGGLNGSGKTTTLLAVRLVLYGRLSLGIGTSKKKYDEFLQSCIHRTRDRMLQANHSSIELSFSYAQMGTENHYRVYRSWTLSGKKIKESLEIAKDHHVLPGLSYEQAQGFLNELIPAGLSNLFFFDGEKIAKLVADQSGSALAYSIKRLLGLDIIEKLNSDLGVIIRSASKSQANEVLLHKIEEKEKELKAAESRANDCEQEYFDGLPGIVEARSNYDISNREFLAIGGAWATTREDEIKRQKLLLARRDELENEVRELFSGTYPLSLAPMFVENTLKQLHEETNLREERKTNEALVQFVAELEDLLSEFLSQTAFRKAKSTIKQLLKDKVTDNEPCELIHDVGNKVTVRIEANFEIAQNSAKKSLTQLKKELEKLSIELDEIGDRIARAPDDNTLKRTVESLNSQQALINNLEVRSKVKREEAKSYLQEAMNIARHLDELHSYVQRAKEQSRSIELARAAQSLLSAYALLAAKGKIRSLEQEFVDCFRRLARKDDLSISATIDPKDFKVTLFGANRNAIDKSDLSSGEKQIYAIAMLEALARTSGRKLPIIIDTPLGRLDSKHRKKLVENYFPHASHQVIILSTDTEVDEAFYGSLFKHMSHAFKFNYDPDCGSSTAVEGYFWRSQQAIEAA